MVRGIQVSPSNFVRITCRYRSWCKIVVCPVCGLRAKYEDCHPSAPCPECGAWLEEKVGRWVCTSSGTWWKLCLDARYEWELRDD